ncbi:MAG: LOG family protein [Candidatus Peribacteraceae bacterium]|nr:LOG family protein [Candidatus Peribacteraceae bacterium]
MLTIERIGTIAQEKTRSSPAPIQQIVDHVLQQWRGGALRGEQLCALIDREIAALPQPLQTQAQRIRGEIRNSLSGAAVEAAEEHAGHRRTAREIYQELNAGFALVELRGRGVVYFGSARTEPGDSFYEQARELGRETYLLLGSTSWSGAGPGQMQAALEGAREAGGNIAGVKINLNANQARNEQKISPVFNDLDDVATCDHFDPRVTSLTDAGWPESKRQEKGAFVFFPGALGTMHEYYVISVIKQLQKVGDNKVKDAPILLMNYDNFYYHLLEQLQVCREHGMVTGEELQRIFRACTTNEEALEFLADHYRIPQEQRPYAQKQLLPWGRLIGGDGI